MENVIDQLALSLPVAGAIFAGFSGNLKALVKIGGDLVQVLGRLADAMEKQKNGGIDEEGS